MKIERYDLAIIFIGQRYKGRFICNGNETNIRECKISYQPVAHCDKGDLLLYCDESMFLETHTRTHTQRAHTHIRTYTHTCTRTHAHTHMHIHTRTYTLLGH